MAGADDIVKQALRLVIGGGDDAAESALRAFAETKFKTPQGKPMRLYHMTPNDITEFRASPENRSGPAVFLSPYPDFQPAHHQSAERGPSGELTEQFKEGANVMPVYADVRNPLVLDHPRKIKEAATKYQGGDRNFPRIITPEARAALEADGYDGVVFGGDNPIPYGDRPMDARLGYQEGRGEEFLVFDPKRVKSAVSNTGEYNFANPDITKSDGGQVREGYQTRGRALATPFERALAYLKREYGNLPPRPVDEAFRLQGEDLVRKSRNLEGKIPILGNEKFGKPLSEMQAEYDQVRPLVEYRERRPHDLVKENAVIYPAVGDLSAAGKRLTKVGDDTLTSPTDLHGGFEFSRDVFGQGDEPAAWASREDAANTMAERFAKRTKEGEVPYLASVVMGPEAVDSTHMMADTVIKMIPGSKIAKADLAKFDAEMKSIYPDWPGIANTEKALAFMDARKRPGTHLSQFVKKLDKKEYRAAGFPDAGEARFAVSEPRLIGAPIGSSGFSLMKVNPTLETMSEGAQHGTYDRKIKSPEGYSGGFPKITPSRLMFPSWFENLHPNAKIDPSKGQWSMITQFPKQKATNEWADNIEKYWEENPMPWGYAYGGEVDDDDIDDAIRIAKDVGGGTSASHLADPTLDRAGMIDEGEPVNYETEVKPFIDIATFPMNYAVEDPSGYSGLPVSTGTVQTDGLSLLDTMKIASQLAASGQPTDDRGEYNWGRMREGAVRRLVGAPEGGEEAPYRGPFSYNPSETANYLNTIAGFSPIGWAELFHDTPYEAGRTGDYGTAAYEGGLNALLSAPGIAALGLAGRAALNAIRKNPKLAAAGAASATGAGSYFLPDDAEADPNVDKALALTRY